MQRITPLFFLVFLFACNQNSKERFINYKSFDSYPLWESIKEIEETNSLLASEIMDCDSSINELLTLTMEVTSSLNSLENDFVNYSGGLNAEDGSFNGDIDDIQQFYLVQDRSSQLLQILEKYTKAASQLGLNITFKHRYYEQSWKEEFTFEEYIFKHETPNEVTEIFNRIILRVQVELNRYLLQKAIDCEFCLVANNG